MLLALPFSTSEWMAFGSAVLVIFFGLCAMAAPRLSMSFVGLMPDDDSGVGQSEMRGALGGVWVGLGLSCILLAQPFTYFALGLAFAFSVIGRLISLVFDRSFSMMIAATIFYEFSLAFFPLKFAFETFGLI